MELNKYFNRKSVFLFLVLTLAPLIIAYTIFRLYPLLFIVFMSFFKWDGISEPRFIGLNNYIELINDPVFWNALKNNVLLALLSIMIEIPIGLILAYLLVIEPRIRCKTFFRVVYFTPMVLPTAALGLLWSLIYDPTFGPLNQFLRAIGLGFLAREWLADPSVAIWAVILVIVWQWTGWYFVLNLAAVSSIPTEILEAALVDGASKWTILKEIVIPLIKSPLLMQITLASTGSLMYFDLVWIMTRGGPAHATEVVATWLYRKAFFFNQFGYGSCMATVLTIITLIVGAYWILQVSKGASYR
ncbi:MAG: sugar ABC transporter permease [Thermoprotei archaeon]|nr:MAG: sugar ABC transporter permease [Thermoprotei archaeon]